MNSYDIYNKYSGHFEDNNIKEMEEENSDKMSSSKEKNDESSPKMWDIDLKEYINRFTNRKNEKLLIATQNITDINAENFKSIISKKYEEIWTKSQAVLDSKKEENLQNHIVLYKLKSKVKYSILKNYFKTWRENAREIKKKSKNMINVQEEKSKQNLSSMIIQLKVTLILIIKKKF